MRAMLPVLIVVLAAPAAAQVHIRPAAAPIVTAEHDGWFIRGDPVQYAGTLYYKAGAAVFFDGNRMVRTGDFNGVPLYADTTLEPFSLVFVPIGRNLMQPYERLRAGELAGTTGSRAPSFPVAAVASGRVEPVAPSPPTNLAFELPVFEMAPAPEAQSVPLTAETLAKVMPAAAARPSEVVPLRPGVPDTAPVHEHIWIDYDGRKWVSAGPAIPLAGSGLIRAGEYAGFPVFTRGGSAADRLVYVPALPGFVTPYRLAR